MRAKARRLTAEHGLSLLIVDYIQLMTGRGRFENRTLELAAISRVAEGPGQGTERAGHRAVAAVAARPRRARTIGRMLSDLRESGALEQDADVVHPDLPDGDVPGLQAEEETTASPS